jgi:predicted metal-dependent hydrolase
MFFKKRESIKERVSSIEHPNLGKINIKTTGVSNRIRIIVKAQNNITLTIPSNISVTDGIHFLDQKIEWIQRALLRQNIIYQNNALIIEDGTEIETLFGKISFKLTDCPEIKIIKNRYNNNDIEYTLCLSIDTPIQIVEDTIVKILKKEAKIELQKRVDYYSDNLNFKYNRLFFKNNKTNWGSCSAANNINLNIHLLRVPSALCDYVILHELCHLEIKNHGAQFHKKLNSLCNNREQELAQALKKYSCSIILKHKERPSNI